MRWFNQALESIQLPALSLELRKPRKCSLAFGEFVRGPAGSEVCSAVPGLIFAGTFEVLCHAEVEEEPTRKTLTLESRELGFGV